MQNQMIPIRESCLNDIKTLAERNGIQKVVLFGSRSRNDYWRGSDIDLAIEGGDYLSYLGDLEEEADTLLRFDVVDINKTNNKELLRDIERDGIVLYEKI